MSETVEIWHPDHPGVTSTVSRAAYERRSRRLGWQLVDQTRREVPGYTPAETGKADVDATPVSEKTQLQALLRSRGIEFDGRSGVKALRKLAADSDPGQGE